MPTDDEGAAKALLPTAPRVDFAVLERLIKMVTANTKQIEWLLEQQSQLRTEYLTFYKKDLKEIFAGLKEILPPGEGPGQASIMTETLNRIISDHRQDLERSYRFIDARYQELASTDLGPEAKEPPVREGTAMRRTTKSRREPPSES